MTAKELIEELSKCDENLLVIFECEDSFYSGEIEKVEQSKDCVLLSAFPYGLRK